MVEPGPRALAEIYRSRGPVLIRGRPGCGRRGLARRIHRSCAHEGPFVIHDCADRRCFDQRRALLGACSRLEAGHHMRTVGILEMAGDGTLLLERIEALDRLLQEDLADVLEQGFFFPLQADQPVSYAARTIVSTAEDLAVLVTAGHFSTRLFDQLGTHSLEL